jgi:hypothetical protein
MVLGVFDHFHVMHLCVSSSFFGFWHELVVTIREFYMACNAWFRWSEGLVISSNSFWPYSP